MQGTTQKQVLKNWMVAKYSLPPSTQTHEEKISGKPGSLLESRLGCNEVRAAGFWGTPPLYTAWILTFLQILEASF